MEYKVAKTIRGRSLSNLIADKIASGQGIGKSIKSSISLKMQAKATGIKEKFDPLNIVRAMTGKSRLATAIAGRLMGRSRRDIQYFTGDRRGYTRIAPTLRLGTVPTAPATLDGSVVGVLNNMLAFMVKTKQEDLKRRETEKAFLEERQNEDLRRHQEFLEVLKEYASISGGTATPVAKEEETGFLDLVKTMIANAVEGVTKTINALAEALEKTILNKVFYGSLKALLPGLALTGPLVGIAALAGLLAYLVSKDTKPGETTAAAEGKTPSELAQEVGPEGPGEKKYTAQQLEKVAEERQIVNQVEDFKLKIRNMRAFGADDNRVKKYLMDYMTLDFANPVEQEAATRLYFEISKQLGGGRGSVVPPMAIPEPAGAGGGGSVNPPMAVPAPEPGGDRGLMNPPMAVPELDVSLSDRMNEVVAENNDLQFEDLSFSNVSYEPLITQNTTTNDMPDRPIPETAEVRDDTAILEYTLGLSKVVV